MNINIIDKDTISVDGSLFKRVVVEEELLVCTLDGYQYFLGPEYDGQLDCDAAKHWCESLGEGYELPNRLVMLAICMNEATAALLTEYSYYWTSAEEDASYAWGQYWGSSGPGFQDADRKSSVRRVRAVRRCRIDGDGECVGRAKHASTIGYTESRTGSMTTGAAGKVPRLPNRTGTAKTRKGTCQRKGKERKPNEHSRQD